MIESNDRAGIAAALRAMAARPDSTPLLATIAVPTLVSTLAISCVFLSSEPCSSL